MAGVNVNLGVSGISQFQQGMRNAQQSVKTLNEQLKLNEAQLKATGNEEEYLQNKTKLLQDAIQKQSEVVRQSEQALKAMQANGVDKTSAAFQQMQQKMYRAQTDLVNLQNELGGVGEAGEEAGNGVDSMNAQLRRIGDQVSFETVTSGIETITEKMEAAARAAINLGKRIVSAMLSGGQWADNLQTTATQWEMTPEQVYRMQQTANIIDTDAETIYQARKKLMTAMGKTDSEDTMGAFAALGISNLAGTDENIEDVFWAAGEALMGMEDKVARNEYAIRLFGRSYEELIPLFSAGREEYEEMMASWTWMGDEQFDKLTKLDDAQQKLTTEWENFQHQFEAALAPAMTNILEILTGLLQEFNTYLSSEEGQKMLEDLGKTIESLFSDLAEIDPAEAVESFKSVFTEIIEGFRWVFEHKEDIVNALKFIVAGWAGLKLTGGILDVMKVLNGLNGLAGGGAASGAASAAQAGAAAAGGTAGISIGSAVGAGAETVGFLLPFALFIDGMIHDQNMIAEWMERGRESMAEYERKTEQFSGSGFFDSWKTLTDYTGLTGMGNVDADIAAKEFAAEFVDWLENDTQNSLLDSLANMMTDEEFWAFNDAMHKILEGADLYDEEERAAFDSAIARAIELMEQSMSTENNAKNSLTSDDIANLNGLPGAIARAVENATIRVYIDGELAGASVAPYVNNIMGGMIKGLTK